VRPLRILVSVPVAGVAGAVTASSAIRFAAPHKTNCMDGSDPSQVFFVHRTNSKADQRAGKPNARKISEL